MARILSLDDDLDTPAALTTVLQGAGNEYVYTTNDQDALRILGA